MIARDWPPTAAPIITDPSTGLPCMQESLDVDHLPAECRGWCTQGRQPCKTPHACKAGHTLHRVIDVLSLPDDRTLATKAMEEIDADNRHVLIACAVLALAIVCLAAFVAGLQVPA
jgi:hypothetical protein